MASRRPSFLSTAADVVHAHSKFLAFLFQFLLLFALLNPGPQVSAEIVLIVALLLAIAQVLCK